MTASVLLPIGVVIPNPQDSTIEDVTSLREELDNIHSKVKKSYLDFGGIGDAVTDDTAALTALAAYSGVGSINLYGKTFKVSAVPTTVTGQYFTNGKFLLPDGQVIPADDTPAMISSDVSTGGIGSPFSGGLGVPRVYVAGGGTGSGAAYTATITDGSVSAVTRINTGNNYSDAPLVKFTGGGGSGAEGVAVITNQQVVDIDIINGGTGYTSAPTISFAISGGAGAKGVATVDNTTKTVTKVAVTAGGSGYTDTPILTVSGNGTGASIAAVVTGGVITSVVVISGGTGYTSATVAITHNGGTGAVVDTVSITSGSITEVLLSSGGSGYSSGAEIVLANQLRGSGASVQGVFSGGVLTKIAVVNGGSGYYVTPTIAGRTNKYRRVMIGSQGSAATFDRSGVYSSIYSHSNGNVSANLAARHSTAGCPQSVNIAAEECEVYGFQGGNFVCQFSQSEGSSTFNLGSDRCATSAAHGGNIASIRSVVGRGNGFRGIATIVSGVITAVTIVDGGTGYSTSDRISASDRLASPSVPAEFSFTVDGTGKILTVSVVYGGIGYSASETVSIRPDPRGDYALVLASGYSKVTNQYGVAVGSRGAMINGLRSGSYSSENCTLDAELSATLASVGCSIGSSNYRSVALASNGVTMNSSLGGTVSIAALNCDMVGNYAVVMGNRVRANTDYSLTLGYGASGTATSANTKIRMGFSSGNISAAGTITGSVAFTDYAEVMPNLTKGIIPVGSLVSLGGKGGNFNKVRLAQKGDEVVGVVSKTALIIAGDTPHEWAGRHLLGEFGEPLFIEIDDPDHPKLIRDTSAEAPYIDNPKPQPVLEEAVYAADGTIVGHTRKLDPDWEPRIKEDGWEAPWIANPVMPNKIKVPVENSLYDPTMVNTPRSERPEDYTVVGFLGQVYIRIDGTVVEGDYIQSGKNGVGTKSGTKTNIRCMLIKKPAGTSYGIGYCLMK